MFGEHLPDLIVIMAIALLIFGPKKLPEMGNAIGKSIQAFRKGIAESNKESDIPSDERQQTRTGVNSK